MSIQNLSKNINAFIDGKGFAGKIKDFQPPKLEQDIEEIRAGGMHTAVEIVKGQKAMTASFTLYGFDRDVLNLWGVTANPLVPLTLYEALESEDGTVTQMIYTLRGRLKMMDLGTRSPGNTGELKCDVALRYYKLEHGGELVHEIHPENMIAVINGNDVLANQRAALGI